jgi:hypothetical protein
MGISENTGSSLYAICMQATRQLPSAGNCELKLPEGQERFVFESVLRLLATDLKGAFDKGSVLFDLRK